MRVDARDELCGRMHGSFIHYTSVPLKPPPRATLSSGFLLDAMMEDVSMQINGEGKGQGR